MILQHNDTTKCVCQALPDPTAHAVAMAAPRLRARRRQDRRCRSSSSSGPFAHSACPRLSRAEPADDNDLSGRPRAAPWVQPPRRAARGWPGAASRCSRGRTTASTHHRHRRADGQSFRSRALYEPLNHLAISSRWPPSTTAAWAGHAAVLRGAACAHRRGHGGLRRQSPSSSISRWALADRQPGMLAQYL